MDNIEHVAPFNCPPKYGARNYHFSKEFISEISALKSHKTLWAILMIWVAICLLTNLTKWLAPGYLFWLFYLPAAILIAGRQGALLQIVHEGAHNLILKNKRWNHFFGNWLTAYPVGLTVEGYAKGHFQHHAHTNTADDLSTDLEKYAVTNFDDGRLISVFLRDLLGLTALNSFFGHNKNSTQVDKQGKKSAFRKNLKDRAGQALAQIILLAFVFQFDFKMYILLWVIPLISFNMVLLRIRGIAEHGLPTQLEKTILSAEQGKLLTRTMLLLNETYLDRILNFFEKILIGSLNCNFHHEHHVLPSVPFYNLPKLNAWMYDELSRLNSLSYVKSYRHAFLIGNSLRKAHVS